MPVFIHWLWPDSGNRPDEQQLVARFLMGRNAGSPFQSRVEEIPRKRNRKQGRDQPLIILDDLDESEKMESKDFSTEPN